MRKLIEFLIYLSGVAFFSLNYYRLKGALDIISFLGFTVFYLIGVSSFATFVSRKMDTERSREDN